MLTQRITNTTLVCLLLIVFVNKLIGQKYPPVIPSASKVETYKQVDGTNLKAWIFNPPDHQIGDNAPAIVFFFGGGWINGTPQQFVQQCEYFAARGMVAITVDYRVLSRQKAMPYQGVEDAKSAIRWMRQQANELGIDPNRIVAAGGSSGGHLAASTATLPTYDNPKENLSISSVPNALALFNPVLVVADIPEVLEFPTKIKEDLSKRFEKDPASLSPSHFINSNLVPSIIFHGTEDKAVPFATASLFQKLATSKGNTCELVAYEGAGHGFFNHGRNNNIPYVSTVGKLDSFLVNLGYLTALKTKNNITKYAPIKEHFPTSTPEAAGISSKAITTFLERAEKEIDALHSFMIIRNGKKVSEGWWTPYSRETPHVMHSLSKSFTSTAIGLLVQESKLSLNDKVLSFFPEYAPEKPTWQWQQMRIRDLLTMNTGHIEEPTVWFNDGDWLEFIFKSEVPLTPGTHFKYNSPATYLLSAIVQKVTGELLVDYLTPRLFDPLKINKPRWDVCPKGINTGGWGLSVTTEDIAKLGQLYLQKGKWNGQQILSKQWTEMATSKQVANGSNPENDWNQGYGFQFWQCRHNAYRGDGAMGQFCIVIPEKDAVIAITAGVYDMGHIMNVVWEELLPAMHSKALPPAKTALRNLKTKTAMLQLSPIKGKTNTSISKKISKKDYTLSNNAQGIQSIDFNLHKLPHSIKIKKEDGTETIPIGNDTYQKNMLQKHLPYTENLHKKIAASGAWITDNEYQLRIYLYEMPERINYTFRFEDKQLTWDSQLEHSLLGAREQEQLTGKR